MIASIPRNWRLHGFYEKSPLMAGVLPRHGLHHLVGDPGEARDAAVAHLATSIASTPATCASNSRFGLSPSGSSTGVSIITSQDRAELIHRAVAAATAERGVHSPLPIGVLGIKGASASNLTSAHACVAELSDWLQAEYGLDLGLVILDIALPHKEALEFVRAGRSVLVASDEAAAGADGVVISIGADGVDVGSARQIAAPIARKAKEPEPEAPIVSKIALIVARGEIDSTTRNKWLLEGYEVVQSEQAALPKAGEIEGGKREIIVAGEDQLPSELRARATRLEWEAVARGVREDIIVRVAA